MQRAVILMVVMVLLGVSAGVWMEHAIGQSCQSYLAEVHALRRLVEADRLPEALDRQSLLYAAWQGEEKRLKSMVSHHHTRAAAEALLTLTTALQQGWRKEALLSLDALEDALADLEGDMRLRWENVL